MALWRFVIVTSCVLVTSACRMDNPAFNVGAIGGGESGDPPTSSGSEAGTSESGVDPEPGDGDGDPTTSSSSSSSSDTNTEMGDGDGDEPLDCGDFTECDGDCVDIYTDPFNCGLCGNVCPEGYCENKFCGTSDRIIFVTAEKFSGNIGGIDDADTACAIAASNAGLPGQYYAWLATEAASPIDDFSKTGAFYLSDGVTLVAESWADLTDGTLLHPIDLNQFQAEATGPFVCGQLRAIWSAVSIKGEPINANCSDWSSTLNAGNVGLLGATNFEWTDSDCILPCFTAAPIYCVQQ